MIDVVFQTGEDVTLGEFLQRASADGLHHQVYANWPTATDGAAIEVEATASYASAHNWYAIYEIADARVRVGIEYGGVSVLSAAATPEQARAGVEKMRELIPREEVIDHQVAVTFWAYSPRGPMQVRRRLDAPAWEAILGNYAAATRGRLDQLMKGDRPGRGGQLILLSGKPGTGKTTAIRALAREWREWADLHYVTDPDKFFGSEADYMLGVLLDEGDVYSPGNSEPRWRVLLLEDAGELLTADARERTGQGLSRFLNAVDGMIGQGLRVLVLVTTNEDVRKLNPAVARPGRCAANIEFAPFDGAEARRWLIDHGGEDLPHDAATLAELFAEVEGFDGEAVSRPLGFASA